MNIYKSLNDITKYIDENLEEEIKYDKLSKYLGVNVYTMQRLFTMIAGVTLSEYIRKRRLSMAAFDLYNTKRIKLYILQMMPRSLKQSVKRIIKRKLK